MDNGKLKTIGIIGGMGPMATGDLFDWITKLTRANTDQDHLAVLIHSVPQIPDRTDFILGKGKDPRPQLLETAKQLEEDGAELLAMPCNTAHAFCEDLQSSLRKAQIINMISETKNYLDETFQGRKPKIGLLATTGTIKTNLYQSRFQDYEIIIPDNDVQETLVMEAIYGKRGIKSGYTKDARLLLRKSIKHLHQKGAEVIIFGCTEISFTLRNERNNGVKFINPIKILAKALIEKGRPVRI